MGPEPVAFATEILPVRANVWTGCSTPASLNLTSPKALNAFSMLPSAIYLIYTPGISIRILLISTTNGRRLTVRTVRFFSNHPEKRFYEPPFNLHWMKDHGRKRQNAY